MMIGHDTVRAYLERELPTASLLYGPASVGKWTLATHLANHYNVSPLDRWAVPHGMRVQTVRLVAAFAARPPVGAFKLITARLDGCNKAALNAMLKTLEEPPPKVRFLFTSTSKALPTVSSRCMTFQLGMLTETQLEHIYRQQGLTQQKARRAARFARGQVSRGYQADAEDSPRSQAVNLAKAIALRDAELFDAVFISWDDSCTSVLVTFLTECLTHRWNTFTEAEAAGLHHDRRLLWQMTSALSRLPNARPRLGVRAALEPFLRR